MVVLRSVDAFGSSSRNAALPVHSAALDATHPAVIVLVAGAADGLTEVSYASRLQTLPAICARTPSGSPRPSRTSGSASA
ncbi:hypothetical protein ACFXPV_15065 [Streptomyces sp. NPDC059118]|uniref:hypothetical protein n=1 Tax=unclassified Streptomyces TaxID=2593676 RepID=UPI0036807821